jgi:pyruvyl transferase EpsO
VVWIRRTDHERAPSADDRHHSTWATEPVDWPDNPGFALLRHAGRLQGRVTGRLPGVGDAVDRALPVLYNSVAKRRLSLGLRMIAEGRVLVTDRLHAHILACLIGRPNVVVDNSYGKVSAFLERWTSGSPLVRSAASHEEGLAMARTMPMSGTQAGE